MPAVSVVMPAYNVAPWLGEAIDSVLSRTYGDLELFVIDDGSTDGTDTIAEQYASRDARVRVIRQLNGGTSTARNHGLRIATGPVIAIATLMARWTPALLSNAYNVPRARLASSRAARQWIA